MEPLLENDDDFIPLAPKPGAHMVLPFIPPKFPSLKGEGNSLIKPSEYLRSLGSRPATAGEMMERLSDDGASSSSGSAMESQGLTVRAPAFPPQGSVRHYLHPPITFQSSERRQLLLLLHLLHHLQLHQVQRVLHLLLLRLPIRL